MTTKHEVIALHHRHPKWTAPQIAKQLGCDPAYVRATAQRNSISLPASRNGMTPETAAKVRLQNALGRAALAAGLTIETIQSLGGRT